MKTVLTFCAVVATTVFVTPNIQAQESPKPGPEHEMLKKMEGVWDATMKFEGMSSKGTMTYKMELGGLWLVSTFEGEFAGAKFSGRGLDSYDARKKKFVTVWVDSMITTPLILEGTYDQAKKTMTMVGDGLGPDGKPTKWKSVTVMADENSIHFGMYFGDAKEPAFTIEYKRKK